MVKRKKIQRSVFGYKTKSCMRHLEKFKSSHHKKNKISPKYPVNRENKEYPKNSPRIIVESLGIPFDIFPSFFESEIILEEEDDK
jgi:hypothetical protein